CCCLCSCGAPRDLPSFPTRRSSDLDGTSCAPMRSRTAQPASPSVEERESQFPFVHLVVLVALREYDVTLVLRAQEEPARKVVAYTGPHVCGLFGALRRSHKRGLWLEVYHPRAEHQERRH